MSTNILSRSAGICLAALMTVAGGSAAVAVTPVSPPASVQQAASVPRAMDSTALAPEARFLLLMTILRGLNKS